MYTMETINEEFEIFAGIANIYNQNNSEIIGQTINWVNCQTLTVNEFIS